MKIKNIVTSLMIVSSLTLVGCSSNGQSTSDDPAPTATASAGPVSATSDAVPEITEEAVVDPLGEGLKDGAEDPVMADEPVDNGLEVSVPTANEVDVAPNEKVSFILTGQEAGKKFEAVIIYASNEEVELGDFVADKSGKVSADIVIPGNIVPGKYSFSLTKGNELFIAPLVVK